MDASEKLPHLLLEKTDLENVPDARVPEGYVLRNYRPGDEEGLARIYAAGGLSCDTRESVRERIIEREYFRPKRLFLVEREGVIVGTAIAWEEAGDPPAGYLHMVAVSPEARGQGLGTLLTVAAIRQNRREGFTVQRLHTDDFRLPAIRLYLDLGYRPVISHESHPARWQAIGETLGRPDLLDGVRRQC